MSTPRGHLTTLPTELLVDIFASLDYFSLMNLRSSCRRFDVIITYTKVGLLSEASFNRNPDFNSKNLAPDDGRKRYYYKLHPAIPHLLAKFDENNTETVEDIGFLTKRDEFMPINDFENLIDKQAISSGIQDSTTVASLSQLNPECYAPFMYHEQPSISLTVAEMVTYYRKMKCNAPRRSKIYTKRLDGKLYVQMIGLWEEDYHSDLWCFCENELQYYWLYGLQKTRGGAPSAMVLDAGEKIAPVEVPLEDELEDEEELNNVSNG